jgi:hypothetical protein
VNKNTGLLIQDYYTGILINYIQRNIFGENVLTGRLRQCHIDYVTRAELKAGFADFAIDLDGAGLDRILDETPAKVAEAPVQILIEPAFFN